MKPFFSSVLRLVIFCLFMVCVLSISAQSRLTNLPTFYINTDDEQGITSKTEYKAANLTVVSPDDAERLESKIQIRGRGNSTWGLDKKPFRIKFESKTKLLGLPAKEKDWVLLANHFDNSLIRNAVAFEIGRILGMETNPSARFVDLYLNNEYIGNYMVTDHVEVGSANRVPIHKQDPLDVTEPAITGGYLLEVDGFFDGEKKFKSPKNMPVVIKYPKEEDINTAQFNYIRNYITDFENRLFSKDFKDKDLGYRAKVDSVTLINWYIATELTGNRDAFWQTFMYKKRSDDKLYFGPLWDYDRVAFTMNDSKLLMRNVAYEPRQWIVQMWKDEWFQQAVSRRWKEVIEEEDMLERMLVYVDETAQLIKDSYDQNAQRWWGEKKDNLQSVNDIKTYLNSRVNFLSKSFGLTDPTTSFGVENRYYKIVNASVDIVLSVENEQVKENAKLVAWENLEVGDDAQLWVIKSLVGGAFRIMDKNSEFAMASGGFTNSLKLVNIDDADDAQKWDIVEVTDEVYGFVNKKTGYAIDNAGGGSGNGNAVLEWHNEVDFNPNQKWYIHKMSFFATDIDPLTISDFEIFPNPAFHFAYIKLSDIQCDDLLLLVHDIAGTQVYSAMYETVSVGQLINIPLSGIDAGMYFITLKPKKGKSVTRKLLVK